MDKNSIYFKAVLESTLIFKIKGTAKSLFDIWVEQAKQRYSNYLFQAQDESLVDDLITAFAKGLEFVWRNENKAKRAMPEWSVSVFLDIVSTTLNTHWSQEYIYKQTHEYKELCFLKILSQFLKVDAITLKKIESLYRHMMKKEKNIIERDVEQQAKIIDLNQFKKNKKSDVVFKKNITDYLDSIYYEKHFLIFGDILKNKSSFVLADFFNNDEIENLIETVGND
ncbi:hypothetical protein BN59_01464 [Legionella massiliensis]|uniref:Uncharacterized protein n=1 Tax=Legionella massiliensis TaxID=1034943 RepID=A0A078KVZ7_9GAMM|nr:hypothetical protein [Legionella massiliensis]CDZ77182.1 hypothetical protein BN59_01464 [Legionella massiliensis]CEE12920.1 hypothetical protein BN1094_01464 [Legionella massiliensis]